MPAYYKSEQNLISQNIKICIYHERLLNTYVYNLQKHQQKPK